MKPPADFFTNLIAKGRIDDHSECTDEEIESFIGSRKFTPDEIDSIIERTSKWIIILSIIKTQTLTASHINMLVLHWPFTLFKSGIELWPELIEAALFNGPHYAVRAALDHKSCTDEMKVRYHLMHGDDWEQQ